MRIEDQVCTFEQAEKLVELGVSLKTVYSWKDGSDQKGEKPAPKLMLSSKCHDRNNSRIYPAPTVAELGILLPTEINLEEEDLYLQGTIGNRQGEFYYIWFQSSLDNVEWELFPAIEEDTEAGARSESLIWLIENDYINAADLKL